VNLAADMITRPHLPPRGRKLAGGAGPYSFARLCPTGRAEAHDGGPPPGRRRAASHKNITVVHHRGRLEQERLTCLPKSFAKPAK
jgi:hypothetical protein